MQVNIKSRPQKKVEAPAVSVLDSFSPVSLPSVKILTGFVFDELRYEVGHSVFPWEVLGAGYLTSLAILIRLPSDRLLILARPPKSACSWLAGSPGSQSRAWLLHMEGGIFYLMCIFGSSPTPAPFVVLSKPIRATHKLFLPKIDSRKHYS